MEKEIWKDIENYEGLYEVSNLGNVKSLDRKVWNGHCYYTKKGRILRPSLDGKQKYYFVGLHKDGKTKLFNIHRLVASAFIPNPYKLPCVNHKDENKTNNASENLEWCTIRYNSNYGNAHKKMIKSRLENNDMNEIIMKTKETKKKNNSYSCEKPVIQYSLKGDIIKEYNSATEAERYTGISRGGIQRCCVGKYKQAKGFIWKYKKTIKQ